MDFIEVLNGVAERMSTHLAAGRRHLLTEDALRWATIEELLVRGVDPDHLEVEHHLPTTGGKVDLVLAGNPPSAVEFKFPRDSRTGFSPDTMTLGELLKDVYRLGELTEFGVRWAVMLLNDRLCGFLARRTDCPWTIEQGERLSLTPEILASLPRTAASSLISWRTTAASARCVVSRPLDGMRFVAYLVD